MLQLIEDLPDHVLGIIGTGKITGEDYEKVLMPAVEDKLSRHDKISCLYQLREGFEGFDAAALWDDAKTGLKHPLSWKRFACVTDVEWVAKSAKAFGFLWPGHVRVFSNADLDEAKEWVSGEGE